jgi:ribosomal-protein-alanine N-acetyltransferase
MTSNVRRMQSTDIPAVVAIDQASFSLPWPESSYRYEVQSNAAALCLVAENDANEVVGMLVAWIIADEMHVATIATRADHRRHGIGSELLRAAFSNARECGVRRAFLEVRAGNLAAQAIYRKFGFELSGRRPAYYRDNGEDALLMTLETPEAQ